MLLRKKHLVSRSIATSFSVGLMKTSSIPAASTALRMLQHALRSRFGHQAHSLLHVEHNHLWNESTRHTATTTNLFFDEINLLYYWSKNFNRSHICFESHHPHSGCRSQTSVFPCFGVFPYFANQSINFHCCFNYFVTSVTQYRQVATMSAPLKRTSMTTTASVVSPCNVEVPVVVELKMPPEQREVLRKDYTPSEYRIKHISMDFNLSRTDTEVSSLC